MLTKRQKRQIWNLVDEQWVKAVPVFHKLLSDRGIPVNEGTDHAFGIIRDALNYAQIIGHRVSNPGRHIDLG